MLAAALFCPCSSSRADGVTFGSVLCRVSVCAHQSLASVSLFLSLSPSPSPIACVYAHPNLPQILISILIQAHNVIPMSLILFSSLHFPSFFFPSKAFLANSTLFSLFPPFNNSKCPARLAKLFSVNAVMPDECFFLNCAVLSAEELLLGFITRAPSCLRLGLLFILERREEEDVSFLIFGGEWGEGGMFTFLRLALWVF